VITVNAGNYPTKLKPTVDFCSTNRPQKRNIVGTWCWQRRPAGEVFVGEQTDVFRNDLFHFRRKFDPRDEGGVARAQSLRLVVEAQVDPVRHAAKVRRV
jgi:hypothetical protein